MLEISRTSAPPVKVVTKPSAKRDRTNYTEEQYMRNSKARSLVLTLDASHTGVDVGRGITDPEFIHNVYDLAVGFALIAACTAQQVAFEGNKSSMVLPITCCQE